MKFFFWHDNPISQNIQETRTIIQEAHQNLMKTAETLTIVNAAIERSIETGQWERVKENLRKQRKQ